MVTRAKAEIEQALATSGGATCLTPPSTLRAAFGKVGYRNAQGQRVPWATDLGGNSQSGREDPYRIPASWLKVRTNCAIHTIQLSAPPIPMAGTGQRHREHTGRSVGILFDGNRRGCQTASFIRTDGEKRACSFAGRHRDALLLYRADELLKEPGFERLGVRKV